MAKLKSVKKDKYGPSYREDLFKQYILFVDSIEKNSDRRIDAIKSYLTLNTIFLSVIGITYESLDLDQGIALRIILSVVGIMISAIYFVLIRSYKQLNTGKFTLLHKIEKELPLALFSKEWELLEEGNNSKVYYPFSHIERYIPWVVGFLYIIIILISILFY